MAGHSKSILVIQSSDGLCLFKFYEICKPNFAAHCCPFRREKVQPRMVEPPSDRDACFGLLVPACRIVFYIVMNNIAYYEHARWRFSIVAGHPSLRGHHCTLRVWAPLSFTGGMKGLDGWVQNLSFLRLPSVDLSIATGRDKRKQEWQRRFGYVHFIRYRCIGFMFY